MAFVHVRHMAEKEKEWWSWFPLILAFLFKDQKTEGGGDRESQKFLTWHYFDGLWLGLTVMKFYFILFFYAGVHSWHKIWKEVCM